MAATELAAAKANGTEVPVKAPTAKAPVLDFMAALKASLDAPVVKPVKTKKVKAVVAEKPAKAVKPKKAKVAA